VPGAKENNMKRVLRIAVELALLVTLAVPAVAVAGPNGSATPFKATYGDETFWTCSGARVVNANGIKDSETCVLTGDTSWVIAGRYSGDPIGDTPPFDSSWGSDYDGTGATSWTFNVVDNRDGSFTIQIVAYY